MSDKEIISKDITFCFWIILYIICFIFFMKNTLIDKNICDSIFWGVFYLQTSININCMSLEYK